MNTKSNLTVSDPIEFAKVGATEVLHMCGGLGSEMAWASLSLEWSMLVEDADSWSLLFLLEMWTEGVTKLLQLLQPRM